MNSCRNKVFAKLQKPLLGGPIAAHSFVLVKSCEARGTNLCKKKSGLEKERKPKNKRKEGRGRNKRRKHHRKCRLFVK